MKVAPGTIAVWSDVGCPWAHLAVHRLHAARRRLGLDYVLTFEHRPFPLELVNERPTPRPTLAAEVPVIGALEPSAGWQVWQAPGWQWPVTTLPALEAVQAVAAQDVRAAEQLDRGLRVAFFAESRCISLRHVILEVASKCDGVDYEALGGALDDGVARRAVIARFEQVRASDAIKGSPHLFLPDGTDAHNPGIAMHWEGRAGEGFPVIDDDDPAVYDDLITRAARERPPTKARQEGDRR
ncbi:MAG TPA: DsbA family protein [Acidimicrobiia bacterium]